MSTENEIKIKRGELIEEYKFLRAEILFMLRKESDYTKFVFTFIIAAITLAYKMEEPTAYFIPLIMSMLIQRQVLVIRETIVKIGAYIYVFLEPEINIKWETRNFNTVNSSDTITKRVLDSPRHLFWSVIHIFIMFLYVCKGSFRIEELNNFLCDMSILENNINRDFDGFIFFNI